MKHSIWFIILFLLSACTAPTNSACGSGELSPTNADPIPLVIDTDMAADDWMAILYLLNEPAVDVHAITVTGAGEAHCEQGVQNALDLVSLADHLEIPVACGRETPLVGNNTFPQSWRDHVDQLAGISIPESPYEPSLLTTTELLTETINNTANLHILTLGPLTNIGELLSTSPELSTDITMITIMGGAVDVPGNVGFSGVNIDNEVAEWNIYVDPHAANIVFESGVPVTLIPLDATNHAPVTIEFLDRIIEHAANPSAQFVSDTLAGKRAFIQSGGYYFWDPLASVVMIYEGLAEFETRTLTVIEADGNEMGWTTTDESGAQVRVATCANGSAFEEMFFATLNND